VIVISYNTIGIKTLTPGKPIELRSCIWLIRLTVIAKVAQNLTEGGRRRTGALSSEIDHVLPLTA
jgi:hypothetical protein